MRPFPGTDAIVPGFCFNEMVALPSQVPDVLPATLEVFFNYFVTFARFSTVRISYQQIEQCFKTNHFVSAFNA
ncbi:MAG TPA: hypothetical protein DDZ04_04140 [Parabacteroides sp.]|nr:hypothetical protein [Parabacteroides sp.]